MTDNETIVDHDHDDVDLNIFSESDNKVYLGGAGGACPPMATNNDYYGW